MGGKRHGSARQRKRGVAAAEELTLRTTSAGRVVEKKDDASLFMIDTVGDVHASQRLRAEAAKAEKAKKRKEPPLELGKKVARILKRGGVARPPPKTRTRRRRPGGFDLWDEDADVSTDARTVVVPTTRGAAPSAAGTAPIRMEELVVSSSSKSRDDVSVLPVSNRSAKAREERRRLRSAFASRGAAVEVAGPGQSYRPDPEHHQEAVGAALDVELRRNEAVRYNAAPISDATPTTERDDDDETESESESDSDHDPDVALDPAALARARRPEKVTRAKRRKQQRVREQNLAAEVRRRERRLLHDALEARRHSRALTAEDRAAEERRRVAEELRAEARSAPVTTKDLHRTMDPRRVPSLPVALTEELTSSSSLRTVRPKGDLVSDRLHSLAARKLANTKRPRRQRSQQGKRRKFVKGGADRVNGTDLF